VEPSKTREIAYDGLKNSVGEEKKGNEEEKSTKLPLKWFSPEKRSQETQKNIKNE